MVAPPNETPTLGGHDQGLLPPRLVEVQHVDRALREQSGAISNGRTDFREIEACCEIVAVGAEHGTPEGCVRLVLGHGLRELSQHAQVEGVHLVGTIENDMHDASISFRHHTTLFAGHGPRS
jgi:hypothetical protein